MSDEQYYYMEMNARSWDRYYRAMCVEDPPLPLPEWVKAAERYGRVMVHWRAHGRCPDHFDEVLRKMGLEKADYCLHARDADDLEWTVIVGDLRPACVFGTWNGMGKSPDEMTSEEYAAAADGMGPDMKGWSPIEMSFVVPDPPDVQILRLLNRIYGQMVTQTDLLKDIKDQLNKTGRN